MGKTESLSSTINQYTLIDTLISKGIINEKTTIKEYKHILETCILELKEQLNVKELYNGDKKLNL